LAAAIYEGDRDYPELAWLAKAHAEEDAGTFLGETEYFQKADDSFAKARQILEERLATTGPRFAAVMHSWGRCDIRWAQARPELAPKLLATAEERLNAAMAFWTDARPLDRAETQYWLGELHLLRGRWNLNDDSAVSYAKAAEFLKAASEAGRTESPAVAAAWQCMQAKALAHQASVMRGDPKSIDVLEQSQLAAFSAIKNAVLLADSSEHRLVLETAELAAQNHMVASGSAERLALSFESLHDHLQDAIRQLSTDAPTGSARANIAMQIKLCAADVVVRSVRRDLAERRVESAGERWTAHQLDVEQAVRALPASALPETKLKARYLAALLKDPNLARLSGATPTPADGLALLAEYEACLQAYVEHHGPEVAAALQAIDAARIADIPTLARERGPSESARMASHLQTTAALRWDMAQLAQMLHVSLAPRPGSEGERQFCAAAIRRALKPLLDRDAGLSNERQKVIRSAVSMFVD
jgi:hypothetical protein